MPTITRERRLQATPESVWHVVSDPARLPAWWPGVARVEEATPESWTAVLTSPQGKTVRADYTRVEADEPRRLVWRHEVEESPFERIMTDSRLEILLEPAATDTRVELSQRIRLRGLSRFGGFQVRRATGRTLEGALEGLDAMVGGTR
jgi:uncharacterized protein YndB with AHSA1/START domain